jgi:hypothetical protein
MSSEEFTEYNLPADAYTAFDATSIRDLIVNKLINDDIYTDQIFEGSNISSLIDVLSYTYHLLLFYLNNTAAESMFADTDIYENINRIVKLLNYNPTGALTSTINFETTAPTLATGTYTIPRYTFISIGTTKYSFVEDKEFTTENIQKLGEDNLLHEGTYREQTFTASGDDFETIVLIQPETGFIDFNNIDVYGSREGSSGYLQYKVAPSLFLHAPIELVYEKRLNEAGDIELKFGNNVTGRKLLEGDTITIFYLHSTGTEGSIGPKGLNDAPKLLYLTPTFIPIKTALGKVFISSADLNKIQFKNSSGSISPSTRESVEDIKLNAVQSFKSQSKLSTAKDYEVYIETRFGEVLSDVNVVNNRDFIDGYLQYIDSTVIGSQPAFESRLLYNHANFSTTTTFNNIYAFIKPRVEKKTSKNISVSFISNAQKTSISNSVKDYRSLTTDLILVDPVYIALDFGVQLPGETLSKNNIGLTQLIITKDPLTHKNSAGIKQSVFNVFKTAFDISTTKLGATISISALIEGIASVEGVSTFKMSRTDETYTFNGLSFLGWNPVYPDNDISIIRQDITFDNFKSPYIFDPDQMYNNIIVE